MMVYKVVNSSGDWVAFKKKEDAEYEKKFSEEMEEDSGGEDKFEIQECEMTEEEYEDLLEWEGW